MRIGLIGAASLGGEHYYNLLEGVIDGRIEDIVLCDNNPNFKPVEMVEFSNIYSLQAKNSISSAPKRIQMYHNIYKNLKEKFPVYYNDYKEMLENENLDAVIIGTPNYLHAEMAVETLSRKISTLCEKPLAVSIAEVDRILSAARKNDTLLQVGLEIRYQKLFSFLREKLDDNILGDLKMAWGREFRGDWKADPGTIDTGDGLNRNWRFSQRHSGGSILEKLCHDLDIMYWLIGSKPVKATAYGGIDFYAPDSRDTIDNAVFIVEYANGVRLNFEYCMFAPYHGRFKGRYMGLIGTKGMLDIDERAGCVQFYEKKRLKKMVTTFDNLDLPTLPGHHQGNSTLLAFNDFYEYVTKGAKKARYNPEDVRVSTHLCLALEESIKRSGETINLESF
ncbi:Gfo/Idh/MocA family oxidoreductase [bacterium]|nr:Gfo/Idh/MocA family oxidoreductase [bacterium]